MARHRKLISESEAETTLDVSSLIDVCFLLLIYFIVTSSITPREHDLKLTLPGPGITDIKLPPIPPMVLRINEEGVVFTGSGNSEQVLDTDPNSRDLPLLLGLLDLYSAAARSANDTPSVLLEVNENVRQQRLIDVLNAFAATGISSVAFNEIIRS